MMKQYRRIKSSVKDAILLFRLGDFYEMFFEDADRAAGVLEIALTSRQGVPMCGIPYHAAARYISRLLKAGFRVAVCEQVEDPRLAKGIVKRELIRVITPGTAVEEVDVPQGANNFLASVQRLGMVWSMAFLDLSTGEFKLAEFPSLPELGNELSRIRPSELLIPEKPSAELEGDLLASFRPGPSLTPLEDWKFDFDLGYETLKKHFGVASLDGFGCSGLVSGVGAAGAVLHYLGENLRSSLDHIVELSVYQPSDYMTLDAETLRNLEVVEPLRGADRSATLLAVLDKTRTAIGSRTLRTWLLRPLLQAEPINLRLQAVEELFSDGPALSRLRDQLKGIRDLQKIISRVVCGNISARDLVGLRESLKAVEPLRRESEGLKAALWAGLSAALEVEPDLVALLDRALVDSPPLTIREGGMIKNGYHPELDQLRELAREGRNWISRYQEKEILRTGIKSLKVRHNKVFGYYLEVTRANLDQVPPDYVRKQTLANAERFVTQELKEYEDKVLGAQEKACLLESACLEELRDEAKKRAASIQRCAEKVGILDTVAALAEAARLNRYVKPRIEEGLEIEVTEGRHPVVERMLKDERFVGNDTFLDGDRNQVHIITGPNMAGKSTYIRQVALIALLAQAGSFVPADSARVGLVDRIFTRVGAADELGRGQSTFMVEMTETANILRHATPRGLVILDEVGRGTSTFDGISIAWAVVEYLHNRPEKKARTLFATHYHELTELELTLPGAKNFNVAVREWNDRVIFLRKVVKGGTDKSYGIQVARLAGLPRSVIERARLILIGLEEETLSPEGLPRFALPVSPSPDQTRQLSLFSPVSNKIIDQLKNLNLDVITPFEALQRLKDLKDQAEEEG